MSVTRKLGPFQISPIGLGCMPMSAFPPDRPGILDRRDAVIEVIHTALDNGLTLLDTADIYAPSWNTIGHNERLVAEAFRTWSGSTEKKSAVVIATKGGITRKPGADWLGTVGRNLTEDYLYRAVEASAARLGVDKIQLWQQHRLNDTMPFEEQMENVFKLRAHGIVQNIGLSNVSAEQLRRAIKIGGSVKDGGVVSVQNEWSPRYRNGEDVRQLCEAEGIAFLTFSPLGGVIRSKELADDKYNKWHQIATAKGVSTYALTIAWHLASSPVAIPIPGSTRKESILDTMSGLQVQLTASELAELNDTLPPNDPVHPLLGAQPPFRD